MDELKNMVIALLLFGIVGVGFANFHGGLAANYGLANQTNVSYIESSNKIIALTNNTFQEIDTTASDEPGLLETLSAPIRGAWNGMMMMLDVVDITQGVMFDMSHILGVPDEAINVLLALITVIVIFALIYVLFKVSP